MYTVRQPRWAITRVVTTLGLGSAAVLLSSSAAPAEGRFVAGSGDAVASVSRLVIRASGLPLTTTFGGALAHYQGESARAEAAALDLGVLGVLLTTPMACGRAPLTADQLPKRTVADSNRGTRSSAKDVAGAGPVGAGREEAAASPGARSDARFSSAALMLGDLAISGARSSTLAELVDGRERRATAEVSLARIDLAGGLVSLRGLRWTATQQTGPAGEVQAAEAAFGLDGMVVGGLPLPTATPLELASALGAANQVISTLGLRLEAPQVSRSAGDREVRVTPLTLVIGGPAASRPVIGPVMTGLIPAREALLAALRALGGAPGSPGGGGGGSCDLGTAAGFALTFVDIVAAGLEGTGGIDLQFGGALATTEGVDYGDPFGIVPPGLPAVPVVPAPAARPRPRPAVAPVTVDAGADVVAPVPVSPARRTDPAPEVSIDAARPEVVAAAPPAATLAATHRCESTSRGRAPRCGRGAPVPAGAAALGLAVLLFGADWWRTRRRVAIGASS